MLGDLATRMKLYEKMESGRKIMPLVPIIARVDGRNFHAFTKGMDRPYDKRLVDLMLDTSRFLIEETNSNLVYTQSDEITLVFHSDNIKSEVFFNRKIQKMVSHLSALTSVYFNDKYFNFFGEKQKKLATFDARVWAVPNLEEVVNCLIWRERDSVKNSIHSAALANFSHNECCGKNGSQMQEMLFSKGINWNDYPDFFKRGTYIAKRKVKKKFSTEEMQLLPPRHAARTNPNLEVERTEFQVLKIEPLTKISDKINILFGENYVGN